MAVLVCFACYYRDNPNLCPGKDDVACSLIGTVMQKHFGTVDLVHQHLCQEHKEFVAKIIANVKKDAEKKG
jgi:hypothetical protein